MAVRVTASPRAAETPDLASRPDDGTALAGIRILDTARVLAAPMISRLLAELGADVIRIDAAPDPRRAGVPEPLFHESANRGKRCLELDIRAPGSHAKLLGLLEWADVVVTNSTPKALRDLRLDAPAVSKASPGVVHVHLSAFGAHGPWAGDRGYAETANAATGITALSMGAGPPSGVAPNVDLPRVPFTDYAAGIIAAFGAMAGLYRRARTRQGSSVTTSLVHAATYLQFPSIGAEELEATRHRDGWSVTQSLYETKDGWIFVGVDPSKRTEFVNALGIDRTASEWEAVRLARAHFARLGHEAAADQVSRLGGSVYRLESIDQLLDAGGPADQRGLRQVSLSAKFGAVVQPGPAVRLSHTPMRFGGLPLETTPWPPGGVVGFQ